MIEVELVLNMNKHSKFKTICAYLESWKYHSYSRKSKQYAFLPLRSPVQRRLIVSISDIHYVAVWVALYTWARITVMIPYAHHHFHRKTLIVISTTCELIKPVNGAVHSSKKSNILFWCRSIDFNLGWTWEYEVPSQSNSWEYEVQSQGNFTRDFIPKHSIFTSIIDSALYHHFSVSGAACISLRLSYRWDLEILAK